MLTVIEVFVNPFGKIPHFIDEFSKSHPNKKVLKIELLNLGMKAVVIVSELEESVQD